MSPTTPTDDLDRRRAKRLYLCLLVFACSFLIRIGTAGVYVLQFDRYEEAESSGAAPRTHAMVKSDAELAYYRPATTIIEQVRSGRSLFFAGAGHISSFLYPRILAIYGLMTGKITVGDDGSVPTQQLFGFLVAQSLLFSCALVYFFIALSGTINGTLALLSSLFIALEPTLVQYNAMIMTESVFVAFLLFVVSTWLMAIRLSRLNRTYLSLIAFGVVGFGAGLLFLQRTAALAFAAVLIIGSYVWNASSVRLLLTHCAFMLAPLAIVLAFVGLHNHVRAGVLYVVPAQGMYVPGVYLANHVLAEVNHSSPDFERVSLTRRAMMQAKAEGLVLGEAARDAERAAGRGLDVLGDMFTHEENTLTEVEFYHLSQAVRTQAQQVFVAHPIRTMRLAIRNTIKSLNIDPLFTYRFYSNVATTPTSDEGEEGQKRQHASQIPIRIAYSLFILLPVAAGWFFWRGALPFQIHVFLTLGMLYFPAVAGWMGWGRYTLPSLVFYAVYWSVGVIGVASRLRMSHSIAAESR